MAKPHVMTPARRVALKKHNLQAHVNVVMFVEKLKLKRIFQNIKKDILKLVFMLLVLAFT